MNDIKQSDTSVTAMNRMAIQLKYKLDTVFRQMKLYIAEKEQQPHPDIDPLIKNLNTDVTYVGAESISHTLHNIETDALTREIVELKEKVEKVSAIVRSQNATIKSYKETLKKEHELKFSLQKEYKELQESTSLYDRKFTDLEYEFDLLKETNLRKNDLVEMSHSEATKFIEQMNNVSEHLNQCLLEVDQLNGQIKDHEKENMFLKSELIDIGVTATNATNLSLKYQLQHDFVIGKNNRLETKLTAISQELERQSSQCASHRLTIQNYEEESKLAMESLLVAANKHAELLQRLVSYN